MEGAEQRGVAPHVQWVLPQHRRRQQRKPGRLQQRHAAGERVAGKEHAQRREHAQGRPLAEGAGIAAELVGREVGLEGGFVARAGKGQQRPHGSNLQRRWRRQWLAARPQSCLSL